MNADSPEIEKTNKTVPVWVPTPSPVPYSYSVPAEMSVQPGSIVQVPLGPRLVAGVVCEGGESEVDPAKLRPIECVFDCPLLHPDMLRFIEWISSYTISPPGMVARMVLRVPAAFEPEAHMEGVILSEIRPERMTNARRRVIETASDGLAWSRSGLAHAAGVSVGVVDGLRGLGVLETSMIPPRPVVPPPDISACVVELSPEQKSAAEQLVGKVAANRYSVTLLDGVTGSGKTEVYFEALAKAFEGGRQALILLPEIALTQAFLDRFEKRFGSRPAQWHSDLAPRTREKVWRQVAEGKVRVVAGARSSLMLPFCELGLIVVDEEHDSAYKQEDRVFYNARDMAVVRAHLGDFPLILASATPSVESRVNADQGRYERLALPERFDDAAMPEIAAIDMRRHPPDRGRFISPALLGQIRDTLERQEQALLFLNRRGYAPLTLCRVCGHRFECPNCSSWLVEHRFRGQLMCHHCGYHERTPEACPECGTLDHLVACGPGVERIAEEVLELFPEARTIVLSSDLMGGVKRLRLELDAIANGDADIIVGTQLVAKGHNFPQLTLVGVLDSDIGLSSGDPRAAERTFQLLSQVTGRAGRTGKASRGYLQTFQPEHPVIKAIVSADHEEFYRREISERQRAKLPPFGRLAGVIISAASRGEAEAHARSLRTVAPATPDITILGPAEAPMALVRGRHRFRLLVHGARQSDIQAYIRALLEKAPRARGSVRVQVDIDPQSFL